MKLTEKIIIIDDDEINNHICYRVIRHVMGKGVEILAFTTADEGLNQIKKEFQNCNNFSQLYLFLDINMPVRNGWDVLETLRGSDQEIQDQMKVIVLSSSIDPKDRMRALEHPMVVEFIVKPLTVDKINLFLQQKLSSSNNLKK